MLDTFAFAASVADCTVETEVERDLPGLPVQGGRPDRRARGDCARRCGYERRAALTGGGADANVFNTRGLPCLNLANGMAEIHTADEHIAVADLEAMVDVTLGVSARCRSGLDAGRVTAIGEQLDRLVRLEVDGIACVAYPRLTGEVEVGDEVLVNEQARLLELGSGGFDVLYANLTRGLGLAAEEGAHVMALPYTPGQVALRRGEEDGGLPESLGGLPVVLCTVHSQVAPVCAALAGRAGRVRPGAGGALPVSLSDTVRVLQGARACWASAIAVAPCLDGDVDCVSSAAALRLGRAGGVRGDRLRCRPGDRRHGTGSGTGRSRSRTRRTSRRRSAAGRCSRPHVRGRPARAAPRGLAPRRRPCSSCASADRVASPDDDAPDGWEEACAGLPLSHMGRGPAEDPAFFRAAFAAGVAARRLLA